jgi:hypothetical protein
MTDSRRLLLLHKQACFYYTNTSKRRVAGFSPALKDSESNVLLSGSDSIIYTTRPEEVVTADTTSLPVQLKPSSYQ